MQATTSADDHVPSPLMQLLNINISGGGNWNGNGVRYSGLPVEKNEGEKKKGPIEYVMGGGVGVRTGQCWGPNLDFDVEHAIQRQLVRRRGLVSSGASFSSHNTPQDGYEDEDEEDEKDREGRTVTSRKQRPTYRYHPPPSPFTFKSHPKKPSLSRELRKVLAVNGTGTSFPSKGTASPASRKVGKGGNCVNTASVTTRGGQVEGQAGCRVGALLGEVKYCAVLCLR